MIFYFSATGNSRLVAESLARRLHLPLHRVSLDDDFSTLSLHTDNVTGFVFPVHAWGLPRLVTTWLRRLPAAKLGSYTFAVLTHGDDMGYTDRFLRHALQRSGARLGAVWSVTMPNTYVALPGFDVDSREVAQRKLRSAETQLEQMACDIERRIDGVCDVRRGWFPLTKSYLLRPLFYRVLASPRRFRVDAERCVSCGRCVSACPLANVRLEGDRPSLPRWGDACTDCLACYHRCPQHAVRYGGFTGGKGQWTAPGEWSEREETL